MPTDNVEEFVSRAEQTQVVFALVVLPLSRMIYAGLINPETVTREQFFEALMSLGTSHENAFEVHATRIDEEMRLVVHCIEADEAKSGVVLLFTLIEGEINSLIRIHLRIRGFSTNAITDALRGTDFDTKLEVLLPLLEVTVPERMRNVALQCKAIRNLVVHNKATPILIADTGDKTSDAEIASERADRFFAENPPERIQRDLREFLDEGAYESSAVQLSRQLFAKFYENSEA